MNFFGHASVACWFDRDPGFVLGAMLPDFFSMLRTRLPPTSDQNLLRGVELHHRTDAAFHGAEAFLALTRTARSALGEAGVARGPARAVAHIGVELLLDEVLAREPTARSAYLDALAHGQSHPELFAFEHEADTMRLVALLSVLASRGAPEPNGDSSHLSERIGRTLMGRPRLALDAHAQGLVADWVVRMRPDVVRCSSALLCELRARLGLAGFARELAGSSEASPH